MSSPAARLLALFDDRVLVRSRDVQRAGIPTVYLTRLVREGTLERVARGLYAKTNSSVDEFVSLAEVASLAPRGVICLLSALAFHGIGTQNPYRVWLALPNRIKPPTSVGVQLEVVRMHPQALSEGTETHDLGGTPVAIFGPSKTIADAFKYRSKIGLDVALEALRDYWDSDYRDADSLRRYAQINGVENVLQPYLEAVAV